MVNNELHESGIFQLKRECNQFIRSLEHVKIWTSFEQLRAEINDKDSIRLLVDAMPESEAKENLISILGYDDRLYSKVVAASIPTLESLFQVKAFAH